MARPRRLPITSRLGAPPFAAVRPRPPPPPTSSARTEPRPRPRPGRGGAGGHGRRPLDSRPARRHRQRPGRRRAGPVPPRPRRQASTFPPLSSGPGGSARRRRAPVRVEGEAYYPAAAMPALRLTVAEAAQSIAIEADPAAFEGQSAALDDAEAMAMTRAGDRRLSELRRLRRSLSRQNEPKRRVRCRCFYRRRRRHDQLHRLGRRRPDASDASGNDLDHRPAKSHDQPPDRRFDFVRRPGGGAGALRRHPICAQFRGPAGLYHHAPARRRAAARRCPRWSTSMSTARSRASSRSRPARSSCATSPSPRAAAGSSSSCATCSAARSSPSRAITPRPSCSAPACTISPTKPASCARRSAGVATNMVSSSHQRPTATDFPTA